MTVKELLKTYWCRWFHRKEMGYTSCVHWCPKCGFIFGSIDGKLVYPEKAPTGRANAEGKCTCGHEDLPISSGFHFNTCKAQPNPHVRSTPPPAATGDLEGKLRELAAKLVSRVYDPAWAAVHMPSDKAAFTERLREAAALGRADMNPWKEAVIDACVVNHIGWDENDPRKTISALIDYENKIALDPQISGDAAELVALGRAEGLEEAARRCDELAEDEGDDQAEAAYKTAAEAIRALKEKL